MTGVHWLLAHCSVLKVRGVRVLRTPSDSKEPPAHGRRPRRNHGIWSATSGVLLTVFRCQEDGSQCGTPLSRTAREPTYGTAAPLGRQTRQTGSQIRRSAPRSYRIWAILAKRRRPTCHTLPPSASHTESSKASIGTVNRSSTCVHASPFLRTP